jgi:hypothetical protein
MAYDRTKEFNEGYEAFVSGKLKTANPYPGESGQWLDWHNGYEAAQDDSYSQEDEDWYADDFSGGHSLFDEY